MGSSPVGVTKKMEAYSIECAFIFFVIFIIDLNPLVRARSISDDALTESSLLRVSVSPRRGHQEDKHSSLDGCFSFL